MFDALTASGRTFPAIKRIRDVSHGVACAVIAGGCQGGKRDAVFDLHNAHQHVLPSLVVSQQLVHLLDLFRRDRLVQPHDPRTQRVLRRRRTAAAVAIIGGGGGSGGGGGCGGGGCGGGGCGGGGGF